MLIEGSKARSADQVATELQMGAKFVVFQYCFSVIVMSFRRSTSIVNIQPGESARSKGLPFTLISLVFGWWGIPWGPIWTVATIAKNLRGGVDVTRELIDAAGNDGIEIVLRGSLTA